MGQWALFLHLKCDIFLLLRESPLYIPTTNSYIDRCLRSIVKPMHYPCMSFPLTVEGRPKNTVWGGRSKEACMVMKCFSWLSCTLTRNCWDRVGACCGGIIEVEETKERRNRGGGGLNRWNKGPPWSNKYALAPGSSHYAAWSRGIKEQVFLVLTTCTLTAV